jgi:hypothetical protein
MVTIANDRRNTGGEAMSTITTRDGTKIRVGKEMGVEAGRKSAGVASLPLGTPVELEVAFEVT